jgi:hypothetical protein
MYRRKQMREFRASLARLQKLFTAPAAYFTNPEVTIWDGVLVVVVLFLVTFWQKLVWVDAGSVSMGFWKAMEEAAVNSLMIWCLFCGFFFALSGFLGTRINLARLAGLVGAAGLPLVFTTLLSALCWTIARIFAINTGVDAWGLSQTIISWLGVIMSWPGVMGYYLMQNGLKIKRPVAILLIGLILVFLVVGRFL